MEQNRIEWKQKQKAKGREGTERKGKKKKVTELNRMKS